MGYVVIPLTNEPNQNFITTIPVDGKNITLKLRIRFNSAGNYWMMSITDPKTGSLILDGIPLLSGEYPAADLLGQYKYLGLGSAAIVNAGNSSMDSPDSTNLGTDFLLVWGDTV
ncbi:hypothetical protein JCM15765_03970 [Paradesulfitobacterium aromaticivorans]